MSMSPQTSFQSFALNVEEKLFSFFVFHKIGRLRAITPKEVRLFYANRQQVSLNILILSTHTNFPY